MDQSSKIMRAYYEKSLTRPHVKRTEFAVRLNESGLTVAVDCGCGTGSDMKYLGSQGYRVYGFDISSDSVAICRDRFGDQELLETVQSSFEDYDYPRSGIVIANSSLLFAEPDQFQDTWHKISSSLDVGGVFAGDFMGIKDSWASNFRTPTSPLSEEEVRALFSNFDVIRFVERDEDSMTSLGKMKHWHTYSVVAVKRT